MTPDSVRPDLGGAPDRSLAEEKFRLAVEACPNGMVMVDREGKMVMVNTEIEHQFGYCREELIGQSVDMLVPSRLRSRHIRHRDEFTLQPETRRTGAGGDLIGLRKDGTEFPVEVGLNPIRTADGLLVLSVIVDISERKRMERLKDEFVATVSHELRTPMTSISASLGLLMGRWAGKLPEPATRLLAIAHKNSQRLVRLIDDILDIEKLEADPVVFNLERVNVRPLVEQAIEDNRGFAEGYGVDVELDSTSVDGLVNADPDRFVQVITNLLSNAIKFSPANGKVQVAVESRGDKMRISVKDHGCGIPDKFKSRIFEKFAQADATSSRQKGGTGLGLSIVKKIVQRLGGEVGFDDALGGGTTFHVDLPACSSEAYSDGDLDAGSAIGLYKRPRILHVDDDRDALVVVTNALRTTGDVVSVDSVEGARRALATDHFDLAVIDISLNIGSGLDLLPDLRDGHGNLIPVIIFSAHGAGLACDQQIQAALAKAHGSLETLVATVRDRLVHRHVRITQEVA